MEICPICNTHHNGTAQLCARCFDDVCRAEELFDVDELERYAAEVAS